MKNQRKEGDFYAAKVRLFLNEYGGTNLEEFCKSERVSYTKMCHCLGRPSYRKPKEKTKDESVSIVEGSTPVILPELELKPLVVDLPKSVMPSSHFDQVRIHLNSRFEISIGSCDIRHLVGLMKEMEVQLC